jgi:oligopeptide/dipeptide ABC transporter ATP-binding protein
MPLLDVQDLQLHYETARGVVRAVDGVTFQIDRRGEAVAIVGESGSGKTSLGLALLRLLPKNAVQYGGSVRLGDTDLMGLSEEEFRVQIRWKRISMVFQSAMNAFNPVLKIGHQIAEPLLVNSVLEKNEAYREVKELLRMVGLSQDVFDRYAHELSGGMRQRAVIAMALILKPDLVILDEPTSALDVSIQAQIMNLLKDLKQYSGISMLFITHDIALASDLCDRIVVSYAGEHVEQGTSERVLLEPKHPYTQGLLASIPTLYASHAPEFLSGTPPDLISPAAGCRFSDRCQYAFSKCVDETPPEISLSSDQKVRCWLYS